MQTVDLTGKWQLRKTDESRSIGATVPGCVHTDLLAAGRIDDPFVGENELDVQWVSEASWEYSRKFEACDELLGCGRVMLVCDGLDTFATVSINGKRIGRADNQFRTWQFDVKADLRAGENEICIRFDSPLAYQKKQMARRALRSPQNMPHEWPGRSFVRKGQSNYGWDWGTSVPTCGIWRDIRIEAFDTARLRDLSCDQEHGRDKVTVGAVAETETLGRANLTAVFTLMLGSKVVAEGRSPLKRGKAAASLVVKRPKLWWPNGMGEQVLYELTVDLLDANDVYVDSLTKRIGLRKLELVRKKDKWGQSFHFAVNGRAFFAKGANWVPADQFVTRLTRADYAHLTASAALANMNMLRVWGGGIYEDDVFYDLCDELGLCVWQDFMFACAAYPSYDEAFMANVRVEAEQNVRRLRHHPCIALWCGNNELEQMSVTPTPRKDKSRMSWDEYKPLFDKLLAGVVAKLDPARPYWPSSAHSPLGDRLDHSNPKWGDAHLWSVWHGRQPFEWYRTSYHRFCSEFGFQSFPEPRSVEGYTAKADRNITSPVMEHHQRSGIGNTVIMQYMLEWFRLPKNFDMTLWASQLLQGLAIKYAVEHWRRNMPRCMGAIYWQLNDCWPVASWSSIDYHGRWKALHYMARNFFAPLMVSGVEDHAKGTVDIHVANDLSGALSARLNWTVTTAEGKTLQAGSIPVRPKPAASAKVKTLDLADILAARGQRDVLIWLELSLGAGSSAQTVSRNLVTFARPKQIELCDPDIAVKAVRSDGGFAVTLKARRPALWAWLELKRTDALFSDNFIHLMPGASVEISVEPTKELTIEQFKRRLRVHSLVDTYR